MHARKHCEQEFRFSTCARQPNMRKLLQKLDVSLKMTQPTKQYEIPFLLIVLNGRKTLF